MLLHVPLRPRLALTQRQTRHLSSSSLWPQDHVAQALLSFGSSLQGHLPEFLPPYATAIIVSTLALRTFVTLPVSLWARARVRRYRELVLPLTKESERQLGRDFKNNQAILGRKVDEAAFNTFRTEATPLLSDYKAQLIKACRCTPTPTLVVPLVTQIPPLILMAAGLRQATQSPTPLSGESFMSLNDTSLALAEPFGAFPLAIGVISLVNLESNKWLRGAALKQARVQWAAWYEKALPFVSVAFVGISMIAPNAITLSWATSLSFTLVQSIIFGLIDRRDQTRTIELPTASQITAPGFPSPPRLPAPKVASRNKMRLRP